MSEETFSAEDIVRSINWLDSWSGDKIHFDTSIFTRGENGNFDGGVVLEGYAGKDRFITARYVLAEASLGWRDDFEDFEDDDDEDAIAE